MKLCMLEKCHPTIIEYLCYLWLLLPEDQISYEAQYSLLRAFVLIVSDKVHCQLVDIILLVTTLMSTNLYKKQLRYLSLFRYKDN